jgi:hypothetical protein
MGIDPRVLTNMRISGIVDMGRTPNNKEDTEMEWTLFGMAMTPTAMCVHPAMMLGREVREGLDQAGFGRLILAAIAVMSGIMTAYLLIMTLLPLGPDMRALAWAGLLGGALAPIVGALAGYFLPRARKI